MDEIKNEKVKITLLAVAQLILSFITDLFIRKINIVTISNINDLMLFIFNKAIAFLLFFGFWKFVFKVIHKTKQKDEKCLSFLKTFTIIFSVNIILLILTWPGIWRFDECKILYAVVRYQTEFWQHYLTSVFYNIALMFIPIPSGVIIFQIIITSAIASYIINGFGEIIKNKKLIKLLYIPFFLLPILDANLYPIRLSIYMYIEALMVCQLIFIKNKTNISKNDIILLAASLIILSVWRSEGILFLLLIPLIFIYTLGKEIPKLKDRIVISALAIILSIILIIPQEVSYKFSSNDRYEMTSFINQLYVVVKKDCENNELTKEDREKIEKVIDIDKLLSFNSGIEAHNDGAIYKEHTIKEFNEFKKVYKKLVLKYPREVFKERLNMFLRTSGFVNNVNVHVENTRIIYTRPANKAMIDFRRNYKTTKPISLKMRNSVINFLEGWNNTDYCNTNILFNIFYNVVPSMVIVFVIIIYSLIKRRLTSFFTFGIIFIKAIAVMVTAPDTYFMYYLPIYLIGYIMLDIIIILKIDKNKETKITL